MFEIRICTVDFDSDMKPLNHGYSMIFVKTMVVGAVTKPLQKILETNILRRYIRRESLTNQISKNTLYQTISEEASLPKKSIQKKSLPKINSIKSPQKFSVTKNGKHRNPN